MKILTKIILFFTLSVSTFLGQEDLQLKVEEAKSYCKENNLDTTLCFFIDMKIHSGKNRLFIYDFVKDSMLISGLCSHGCCENTWGEDDTKLDPKFSNVNNSHCSSLGMYKIGKRGYSNWGIHVNYKLHGLETTNSNAYNRIIVLHSWNMIPQYEIYPNGTPEGWGCPAVSNTLMKYLDDLLKQRNQSVLLWIYN